MLLNRKSIYRQRRRVLIRKIGLISVLFIALLWGLSYFSRHPKVIIQNILVEGNRVIPAEEIKDTVLEKISGNYFFLFSKKNFLIYPKRSLEKDLLDKFHRIEYLSIKRLDRNTLAVSLKEWQGKYLLCEMNSDDDCYFMNSSGFVFDKAPNFSGSVYFRIYSSNFFKETDDLIGQTFMPMEEFAELLDFKEKIGKFFQIKALEIGENGDYKFLLEIDGNNLNPYIAFKKPARNAPATTSQMLAGAGGESDFDKIFDNLALAIGAEPLSLELKDKIDSLEYLDLRYDNKVLYKFSAQGEKQ